MSFYVDEIYRNGMTDNFTWALRSDPELLYEDNFIEWLQVHKIMADIIPEDMSYKFTKPFIKHVNELRNVPGIYTFWNSNEMPLYVGMSCDLGQRIFASFNERFNRFSKIVFLRTISARSVSDAALLEVYYISTLRPALNTTSKYGDKLNIKIECEYKLSPKIKCNILFKDNK